MIIEDGNGNLQKVESENNKVEFQKNENTLDDLKNIKEGSYNDTGFIPETNVDDTEDTLDVNEKDNEIDVNIKEAIKEEVLVTEFKEEELKDLAKEKIVLPSGTIKDLKLMAKHIEAFANRLSKDELIASTIDSGSESYLDINNINSFKTDNTVGNEIKVDDKDISVKDVKFKKGVKLTGDDAVIALLSKSANGAPVKIPLYHSGFTIVLNPLNIDDIHTIIERIKSRELEIAKNIKVQRLTTRQYYYIDEIISFILDKLHRNSLNLDSLDEEESILDYIKIQDFDILIAGIAKSMYPSGFESIVLCSNIHEKDENGNALCTNVGTVKVDPARMVFTRTKRIGINGLRQLSNVKNGGLDKELVKKYQDELEANKDKIVKVKTSSNVEYDVTLKVPTFKEYLTSAEYWENLIRIKFEEIGEIEENDVSKEDKMKELVIITKLTENLPFIKSIGIDGIVIDEPDQLLTFLTNMITDTDFSNNLNREIIKFKNGMYVSVVGLPQFKCSVCQKTQETLSDLGFPKVIGVNTVGFFSGLSVLKLIKASELDTATTI